MGDYPWLVKRMGAVRALAAGQEPKQPRRHPMAVMLALFVPRFRIGGAGGLIVTVALVGVLAAIAIPAYQAYVQTAQVAQAYEIGRGATAAVEKYYYANNTIPPDMAAAGISAHPASPAVELVRFDAENAKVQVITRIVSPHGQGLLEFTPALGDDKRIRWTCRGEDLAQNLLPAACKTER